MTVSGNIKRIFDVSISVFSPKEKIIKAMIPIIIDKAANSNILESASDTILKV